MSTELYTDLHACSVLHPDTGIPMPYKDLIKFDGTKMFWSTCMCKELGRLTQGYKDTAGTDTMFFLTQKEIKNISKDCVVTYARIVVDY